MPKVQLVELYAHGLGVVDDAHLEFGPGFNVITGETGAGKTLLLGALGLCVGADTSASRYALTSDTRAVAVFVREDTSELALAREMTGSGRLRSSLNGTPSSAEALRAASEELIVIQGQHDSLSLRSRAETLSLLDGSGAIDTTDLDGVRRELREARRHRDALGGDGGSRQRELDFLAFQLDELEGASIRSAGELGDVLEELTRLTTLRDGQAAVADVVNLFDGDEDGAVLAQFARALERLPEGSAFDGARHALRGALVQAREAMYELAAFGDPDAIEPSTIETLEVRAGQLQRLARKYGGTLETALTAADEFRREVDRLSGDAEDAASLDQSIRELEVRELALAQRARAEREMAAAKLTRAIRRQLARVALPHAALRFTVGGEDGSDVQIVFAPNPGLPEGPLSQLASGGELSRVLLAISLETSNDGVVSVYDEVDAGIGGQVAQQIGECLSEVGRRQQVLAVTHLASVAARADHHFVIEKVIDRGVTRTNVHAVSNDDRVREIARMLVGDGITPESKALAQQLLENSIEVRQEADLSR